MSASKGVDTSVALLGRNGPARERLREALSLIGARVVLEDEPAAINAQTLTDAGPTAVLVALEPAIEDALEALEPALQRPGLTVIFDEAELAVRREGWDAQRWARHLSAKLHGHDDVLPPGAESEPNWTPEPGLTVAAASTQPDEPQGEVLDAVQSDAVLAASRLPGPAPHAAGPLELLDDPFAAPPPTAAPAEPVAAPAATPAAKALGDSSTWGLVDEVAVVERPRSAPGQILSDGGLSLVDLEPAADGAAGVASGAVLVMAGIGGPDAIRRLLAALPAAFPRAVMIRMALDGGQYGNLVRQMGRASALPVELAEAGQRLSAGTAYILPDGVGVEGGDAGLRFVEGGEGTRLVSALPPADSAVLLLSGASPALVAEVLSLAGQGAWVAGQSAEGCYDPAAAAGLVQQGRPSGDPTQLAQALAERWPS